MFTSDYRQIRWSDVSDQSTVAPGDWARVEFGRADYGTELLFGWEPGSRELDRVPIPEP